MIQPQSINKTQHSKQLTKLSKFLQPISQLIEFVTSQFSLDLVIQVHFPEYTLYQLWSETVDHFTLLGATVQFKFQSQYSP